MIWYNSAIKINNKVIFYSDWLKKGVKTISDLCTETNTLLTFKEFSTKVLKLIHPLPDIMELFNAIPPEWKQILGTHNCGDPPPSRKLDDLLSAPHPVKEIYSKLNADSQLLSYHKTIWENKFDVSLGMEEFVTQLINIKKCTNSVKLRSFQYRLMCNAILTNIRLFHMKMVDTNLCTFCKSHPETYSHLFFFCEKVKPLVNYVQTYYHVEINFIRWMSNYYRIIRKLW